ncbi:MAG TPA: SHOCT domain-containing protein [Ferruginibacter sp.]|jgi:hypothetical protein|nr:SHOCT domain-containing protein [Ferruginibacter sp.]
MKFIASRLSKDNKLFPSEIYLESTGITIKIPGLFSGETKHFDYNHIASVEIDTPLIGFSAITIFAGGTKMSANGFTKAEVKQIKEGIEAGKLVSGKAVSGGGGQTSIGDEIKKLKELLESGILTQQEFDAQKVKLLNS